MSINVWWERYASFIFIPFSIFAVSQNLQFKRSLLLLSLFSPLRQPYFHIFLVSFSFHTPSPIFLSSRLPFCPPKWHPGGVSVPSWQWLCYWVSVDSHTIWRGAMWQLQQPWQTLFLLPALSPSTSEHRLYCVLIRVDIWATIKTDSECLKS